MKRSVLFVGLVVAAYSCTDDQVFTSVENELSHTQPLEIITKSLTAESLNFTQAFSEGMELGLFVHTAGTEAIYTNKKEYGNIKAKAVREKGKICWHTEPEVWLSRQAATVVAYAPYRNDIDPDALRIPVKIAANAAETVAYMYGTHTLGHKKVNYLSPMVLLNMNYALSQIVFRIARHSQADTPGRVSSVQIGNKGGGNLLAREGLLDLVTGEVTDRTGLSTPTRLHLAQPLLLTTHYQSVPAVKVLPTVRKMKPDEVEALFTIDGKSYALSLPGNIRWKKGYTYTYQLVYDGHFLRFERLTVTDWEPGKADAM